MILETVKANPDLIKRLYQLFSSKFDPALQGKLAKEQIDKQTREFYHIITTRFMDFSLGCDIFGFMHKLVSSTLKTNFYQTDKRSFAFRLDNRILDPLVFSKSVYGIFYVNGHYACGTHLRA